ncbi:hypothetical protein GGR51DRAFT_557444 [Nemania sp. FL0031]|nr:hypothetical protein GGR51DRAFT_557444 [Nemania sp. FL0031]
MRSFYLFCIFPLFFGLSLAQNIILPLLPNCAAKCFNQEISATPCSATDLACLCADATFLGALQACEGFNCTVKETLSKFQRTAALISKGDLIELTGLQASTNVTLSACGVPIGDISSTLVGIAASFGSLAMLLFFLRIFDRVLIMKVPLGLDDYWLTLGVILGSVLNFICYPMAEHGLGKDIWTLSFPDISFTLELLYIAEIFYFPSEMFTQLSILAFYRRVFAKSSSITQKGSIVLMVFVVLFGTANTLTIIFQCTPVSFFWTGWTGETTGTCIDINSFSWARAAIEIAVDIAILSLPLRDIVRLQLSWRKKAQVLFVFILGFVITIVSILRLQSLIHFAKTTNITHDNTPAVYWSVLECDVFIITACLPSLRSILAKLTPRWFGTTKRDDSNSTGPRKYYRQDDVDSSHDPSSHQSRNGPGPGGIMKRVDLHISNEPRETGDDIELLKR